MSPPNKLNNGATQFIKKTCAKQNIKALINIKVYSFLKRLLYLLKKKVQKINSCGNAEKTGYRNRTAYITVGFSFCIINNFSEKSSEVNKYKKILKIIHLIIIK
jgi:hypothetical protein